MSVSTVSLKGSLQVPGDKSISHRAVLFSAMAEGTSNLEGLLDSDDVRSSLAAVAALGAEVNVDYAEAGSELEGTLCGTVTGWGNAGPKNPETALDCGNSGTTTRLLLGLLSGYEVKATLCGDASLSKRPMARVCKPLENMGSQFETSEGCTLPITVSGTAELKPLTYDSPVASAQVKTSLMLAGIHAVGTTTLSEPAKSRDHTERMLPAFGVDVSVEGNTVSVSGPASLHACDVSVPGDPSSAAFFLCAAAMAQGSELTVRHVSLNDTRLGFLKVMRRMGAHIKMVKTGFVGSEPVGDITVYGDSELTATSVPAAEIASLIDEIPILALFASCAQGTTVFQEVGELRVKESDRLAAIVNGLCAMGVNAYAKGDDLYIESGAPCKDASLSTHGDHRLAMTWSLADALFPITVELDDRDCVSVSYPKFFEHLASVL